MAIPYSVIEDSIAERLGGNPSYRLVSRLAGYAYNIFASMGWPAAGSLAYDRVVCGLCNAAITGSEEMHDDVH